MGYVAALYSSNGHLVTGCHHGDAFGKLTAEEQEHGDIKSGFLDAGNGKFVFNESKCFYVKHILLIRHVCCRQEPLADPHINDQGVDQAHQIANALLSIDLNEYQAFTSPVRRCQETAEILSEDTQLPFNINPDLKEMTQEDIPTFRHRLEKVLDTLPIKSIVVAHHDVIVGMINLAVGNPDGVGEVDWSLPYGSISVVRNGKVPCSGIHCQKLGSYI